MHIPQIWTIWYDPSARCNVCHGAQHNQRENLHLFLVLVRAAFYRHRVWFNLAHRHRMFARQKSQVQRDGFRPFVSGEIESVEGVNGDAAL